MYNLKIVGPSPELEILSGLLPGSFEYREQTVRPGLSEKKDFGDVGAVILGSFASGTLGQILVIIARYIKDKKEKYIDIETEDGMKFRVPYNISDEDLDELLSKIDRIRSNLHLTLR